MRQTAITWVLVSGIAVTSSSCDPVTAVAVPVLVITNSWAVEGQEGRSFEFTANEVENEGLEQGTFEGFEVTSEQTYELTGSWDEGQIQFTVVRPGGNVLYTGTFDEDRPTRLTVHSTQPAETITLVKSSDE